MLKAIVIPCYRDNRMEHEAFKFLMPRKHTSFILGIAGSCLLGGCLCICEAAEVQFENGSDNASKSAIVNISNDDKKSIDSLIDQANSLKDAGKFYNSLEIYKKVYSITKRTSVLGEEEFTILLNNMAQLYYLQGLYVDSEKFYLEALNNARKHLKNNSIALASILGNLAQLYHRQGNFAKAEPLYLKTRKLILAVYGRLHPDVATILNNLGVFYEDKEMYGKAETLLLESLKIREETLEKDHPDIARSLNNLGHLYKIMGLSNKAERFFLKALAIREKKLGPNHPDLAESLNNLAWIYLEQGLSKKAEPLFISSLSIREMAHGIYHPDTSNSYNNLASMYFRMGFYEKARPLYTKALEINEKVLGADHPETANVLYSLGELMAAEGLFERAGSYYLRSLNIRVKAFGMESSSVASALSSISLMYMRLGLYADAEPLLLRALEIREKKIGRYHPDTAASLNELGALYGRQGKYATAEKLILRAIIINGKVLGYENREIAYGLMNLAGLYELQGLALKAEGLYVKSLDVNKQALGNDHPEVINSLSMLSDFYFSQGNFTKAYYMAKNALLINIKVVQREANLLARSDRQIFLNSRAYEYDVPYAYSLHNPTGANLALFSRLNRQGLLEDIEKRQAQLSKLPGPQQEAAEQLRAINKQISSLSLSPKQRKALKIRQEELEAQLYRLLPELKPRIVEVQQVAAALPSTGALVEYQRYQPFDGKKPNSQRWGKPRYLALVLKANGSVAAVDLGPAAVIEERIQQALRATQEQLSDANQLWGQVGKQVLDPLTPALKGVQTLFVSPDGELNRIPFAALPAPGGKALLGDALQLRLLTTGRELLDLAQPHSQAKSPVLVLANPNFDQLASNAPVTAVRPVDPVESPLGIGGQQRSADLGSLRWSALPGTVKEGQAIAALTGATLLSGSQASATAIEKQAAPRILHIASHGYFLANQPTSPLDKRSLSNSGLPPMGSLPAANLQGESPLLRSGIVLAGANQNSTATGNSPGDRGDDGYLTALEITQLDWKGTELVVISACESGKGDIQAGEGVYGLKRAIAVAGARSSLLSLWKVDDAATAAFMQSFYEKLKTGQGRADALAATQKEFRNHSIPGWRHPYVWAAFQLSGDWGPIPGI